ncbi:MAG: hypothetical protein R6V06_09015 [Kiritimatiellia bacterium]
MNESDHISPEQSAFVGVLTDSDRKKVDSKRRLTMRSVWRSAMGSPSSVYMAPGEVEDPAGGKMIRCIEIIPPAVFNEKKSGFQGMTEDDPRRLELERYLRYISYVEFDGDGRLTIPKKYLKFAGIENDVVLNGSFDRIKVWAAGESSVEEDIDLDEFKATRRVVNSRAAGNRKEG